MLKVEVNKPIKTLTKKYKFKMSKVFEALGKAAIMLIDGKAGSAAKEIISFISSAEKEKQKAEEMAFWLIFRSIGKVSYNLFSEINPKYYSEKYVLQFLTSEDYKNYLSSIDNLIDKEILSIDKEFFKSPHNLSILSKVEIEYLKWLKKLGVDERTAIKNSQRFKEYFVIILNEEWNDKKEEYKIITDKLESPFEAAIKKINEWESYYKILNKEINQNLFDESFSLKDIYIPLRGSRYEYEELPNGQTGKIYFALWLEEYLNSWIERKNNEECIKFISGGPGSGKSSFVKMWAIKLIKRKYEFKVLFIQLQWFNIRDEIVKSIDNYIENLKEIVPLSFNPLRMKNDEQLIVIFDGLDELSEQGEYAAKISTEFLNLIERENSIINKDKANVYFLITGREITIQFNEERIGERFEIINLLPYNLDKEERSKFRFDPIVHLDQRDDWWRKYGKLKSIPYTGIPEVLKNKLPEVTALPFLNYLVAWNINEGGLDENKIDSSNNIYHNLITQILERKYASLEHPSTKGLKKNNFLKVLQEISIAAWHGGDARIAKYKDIQKRLSYTNLDGYFEIFNTSPSNDALKLLTTFYFKQHSFIGGERKIEFTHKTFGEYLVATYLIDKLQSYFNIYELDSSNNIETIKNLLSAWYNLTGLNQIDNSINKFLFEEITVRKLATSTKFYSFIKQTFEYVLENGILIRDNRSSPNIEMLKVRNSEEAMYLILNATSRAANKVTEIKTSTLFDFGNWIHKINLQNGNDERLLNKNLTFLKVSNSKIYNHNFHKSNLSNSDFSNSNLSRCNFVDANLSNSLFVDSTLIKTNLLNANLKKSDFSLSRMYGTDFRYSNLNSSKIISADLKYSDFRYSKLFGTTFKDTDLAFSDFSFSNITLEQLLEASSLYMCKGIREEYKQILDKKKPELFYSANRYDKL